MNEVGALLAGLDVDALRALEGASDSRWSPTLRQVHYPVLAETLGLPEPFDGTAAETFLLVEDLDTARARREAVERGDDAGSAFTLGLDLGTDNAWYLPEQLEQDGVVLFSDRYGSLQSVEVVRDGGDGFTTSTMPITGPCGRQDCLSSQDATCGPGCKCRLVEHPPLDERLREALRRRPTHPSSWVFVCQLH